MVSVQELSQIRPSKRQIDWQETEFYGFIHFGMNTMTNKEWGDGQDSLALFDPPSVDCRQWVKGLKQGGMKGLILTCKHHDGFCLWPTQTSAYSVKNTPWKNGQGDLVAEVSQACAEENMKFGIYLSPWDRHAPVYGSGEAYDAFYIAQLTELLTHYGDIFEVWFDGANGEVAGKQQRYDWQRYFDCVRQLQPQAVMAVCGPDVRWVGNEAGHTRVDEWSVVPEALLSAERTMAESQKVDDGTFGRANSAQQDLGSQTVLAAYQGKLVWYPAEVNTSIRPGWFYHAHEDQALRSSEELFTIYQQAVGGNSTFLLNVPPMPNGLMAPNDLIVLNELGEKINALKKENHVPTATCQLTNLIVDPNTQTYRSVQPQEPAQLLFEWAEPVELSGVSLKEVISFGQQIESYQIYTKVDGQDELLATGNAIGYQRIVRFPKRALTSLEVRILKSRGNYHIEEVRTISL
ncbi:MAG TPA: alpha-L-fucosidase [Enterococcus sp.]|nr:alpha-L-fucosidase [Enterococcus sp.]